MAESLGNRAIDALVEHGLHGAYRVLGAVVVARSLRQTCPGITDAELALHLAVYASNSTPPLEAGEMLRAIRESAQTPPARVAPLGAPEPARKPRGAPARPRAAATA